MPLTIQFKQTLEVFIIDEFKDLSRRAGEVEWISANDRELNMIVERFTVTVRTPLNTPAPPISTIPLTSKDIVRWYGSIAQTIVANL